MLIYDPVETCFLEGSLGDLSPLTPNKLQASVTGRGTKRGNRSSVMPGKDLYSRADAESPFPTFGETHNGVGTERKEGRERK